MKIGFAPLFVLVSILAVTSPYQRENDKCNNKDICIFGLACCYGRCRKVHVFMSAKCSTDKQCGKPGKCFKGYCAILDQCVPEDSWESNNSKAIVWRDFGQRCSNKDKCMFGFACCYGKCRHVHVFMSAQCSTDKQCGKPGKCFKGYCTILNQCVPDDSWESENSKAIVWRVNDERCNNKNKCMLGFACCYGKCRKLQFMSNYCSTNKQCIDAYKCFKGYCTYLEQCVPEDSWEFNNSKAIAWRKDGQQCSNKDKCMIGLACCYGMCRYVFALMPEQCSAAKDCGKPSKCFKGHCTLLLDCVPEDSWKSENTKAIVWRENGQRCSNKDKCMFGLACCRGKCVAVSYNPNQKCLIDLSTCPRCYKECIKPAKCFKGFCTILNDCVPEDS